MSQSPSDDPRDDPSWDTLPLEGKKRIMQLHVQDLLAAALIDELDMCDDEADTEAAAACDGVVPASKKAIVELHTPTWEEACCRSRAAMEEEHVGGCAVCLESLEKGQELRMMPCSHTFHQLCIFRRLVVNRLCPICQFALPSSDEEDQDMLDEEEEDEAAAIKRYYTPEFIEFIMNF